MKSSTGGKRIKNRLRRQMPLPKLTNWSRRAEPGISGRGSAAVYKMAEIPSDAAIILSKHFGEGNGKKLDVLDTMAGSASFSIPIAQYLKTKGFQPRLTAMDITSDMLRKIPDSKELGFSIKTINADIRWKPLPNKTYDTVVSRYGMERLSKKQQIRFLRDARNSLRPGGVLVLHVMISPEKTKAFMKEYKIRKGDPGISGNVTAHLPTHENYLEMFEKAGFKPLKDRTGFHLKEYTGKAKTTGWFLNNQFGEIKTVKKEGENEQEFLKRAQEENPLAEKTRMHNVAHFWLNSTPQAVKEIGLRFFDKEGNEIPWIADKEKRAHMFSEGVVHETEMTWPVMTYVAMRAVKGATNVAGKQRTTHVRPKK